MEYGSTPHADPSKTDLELAKSQLTGDVKLCLVCDNGMIINNSRGIAPLVNICIDANDFYGGSVADRIVGKAAALLYVYMGIKHVYAQVLSTAAEQVLIDNNIAYEYGTKVERIINRTGDGTCPMEQTVANISSPRVALEALKQKLKELSGK